jgi:hypothetical protein
VPFGLRCDARDREGGEAVVPGGAVGVQRVHRSVRQRSAMRWRSRMRRDRARWRSCAHHQAGLAAADDQSFDFLHEHGAVLFRVGRLMHGEAGGRAGADFPDADAHSPRRRVPGLSSCVVTGRRRSDLTVRTDRRRLPLLQSDGRADGLARRRVVLGHPDETKPTRLDPAAGTASASFCSCFPTEFSCISMVLRVLASPNRLPSPFASMDLTEETAGLLLWLGDFRRVRGMAVSRRWLA